MKYTASLFSVLALVGTLVLPLHYVSANEIKTTTSNVTSDETTSGSRIIGKVSYLLGQADMILLDGSVTAITKQTKILEGSKVSVKDRSKLNLLMVDGAIEKLPANSTLEFERYYYDPANPKATEIRKELIEGEVTSKTGIGGAEAKERYRLNSPLAAIAVLGTEYTVRVSDGETSVVVLDGIISMAKLGGSCQRSGFGACVNGEQLAAHQRGFALVVRQGQPRPVLIPAAALPPPKSTVQTSSAREQAKEEAANKKAAEEVAAKEKAVKVAEAKKADKQEEAPAIASVTKSEEKSSDKSSDKTTVKETVAPVAEKTTDTVAIDVTKTVDERDPLAEVKAEVKEVKIKDVNVVTAAPAVVVEQPKTVAVVEAPPAPVVSNLESTQPSSLVTPSTPASTTTAPPSALVTAPPSSASNAMLLVSSGSSGSSTGLLSGSTGVSLGGVLESSTGSTLLESASGSALRGGLITTPLGAPLGGAATNLVESSSKTQSTVTTDAGEVIAAVTPPPVVETPVTPVTPEPSPALPVRFGKYDPATVVDGVTLGDQVSSLYQQVVAPSTLDERFIERHQDASASLPEQRDVAFALDSYEATVRDATAGTQTAATITDARLTVSSASNSVETGFTLNSPLYTGAVQAIGTYSPIDGTFRDDGTNPQTTINGAVGVLGEQTGAAYIFTHQIDTTLSADGGLNWTGATIGD